MDDPHQFEPVFVSYVPDLHTKSEKQTTVTIITSPCLDAKKIKVIATDSCAGFYVS